MRTVLLEDRVPMVLHRGRSMLAQYWDKTAKRYLEDVIDTSSKSPVLGDFLKMAEAFEVPETGEV